MKNIIQEIISFENKIISLIEKCKTDDFLKLPNMEIKSVDCLKNIPNISCIYFLFHKDHGILYVGKSDNLNKRWQRKLGYYGDVFKQHFMFIKCIDIKNVFLSWAEMPKNLSIISESIFIKSLKPKWNTVGNVDNNKLHLFNFSHFEDEYQNALKNIDKSIIVKNSYYHGVPEIGEKCKVIDVRKCDKGGFNVHVNWKNKLIDKNKNKITIFPMHEFNNVFF